jgi:hypothetical protein
MEDNAKPGADASPNGKPQADSIWDGLWLRIFLFIGHVLSFTPVLKINFIRHGTGSLYQR